MGAENRIDLSIGIVQDDTKTAVATIAPGSLLVVSGAGYGLRGAGADNDPIIVAGSAPERGKGIDDNYASGETIRTFRPGMGQAVNVLLAASQTVAFGDDLAAAANGEVTQSGVNARLTALEAVTTGAGQTALIKCTPKQS